MKHLIDRQETIDTLKEISFTHWFELGEYIGECSRKLRIINADKAIEKIGQLPSVQPERQTGEWIFDENIALPFDSGEYRCSVCDSDCCESYWNYCPYCGSLNWKIERE